MRVSAMARLHKRNSIIPVTRRGGWSINFAKVPELGICGKKTPQADYALGDSRYLSIGVWPSSPGWGAGEAARSSLDHL